MITLNAPTMAASTTTAEPLAELVREAELAIVNGERVQVVFDLDDTLFLVHTRKRAIFRELAETYAHEAPVAEALNLLATRAIPYDVKEALHTVGIAEDHHVGPLKSAFFSRFFDGRYTRHDAPNEGAKAYVVELHAMGVHVVYLTGRPEEMEEHTLETLAMHGFPVNTERTELMLKRTHESHLGDAEFKGLKAAEIGAKGRVLATFDNEPANLNAMLPSMPEARFFLLDTDHSPNPPALEMDVHVVVDFEAARRRLASSLEATPSFTGKNWSLNVSVESASV